MKMLRQLKAFSLLTDILLLTPLILFTGWVYLIPPLQTFGYHPLFSDDAIFAMLARKVLEEGPSGAFHLAWGPLLPWLNALLNKLFNIPLEEGPRIITGLSLTLRVIPIYLLSKYLFGKMAALVSIILVSLYTFLLVPQEATLAEGLYSLVIFTGFLISYIALKTEKLKWYFFAGGIWGLAYLTRLEGWFFLIPLLILTGLRLFHNSKKHSMTLKLLVTFVIAFLLISSPFLIFIKQVYGAWTLNPRASIVLVAPGNLFTFYKDINGITTPAQAYFSGDPKSYNSSLWHPEPFVFWRAIGRSWSTLSIIPTIYFKYFWENTPVLLIGGILGLLLTLTLIFQKKLRLLATFIFLTALLFTLLDFSLTTLEFTSPILFNPEGNLALFIVQFWRMLHTKGYLQPLIRDLIIALLALSWLIYKRKYPSRLARHVYANRLAIYLPLTLLLGFMPLFFNSFANKYAIATGVMFALFTGFFITSICSLAITLLRRYYPSLPYLKVAPAIYILALISVFWINRPQFYQALNTRETQYKALNFQASYLKKPGLVILNDHGPGAKVAVFHEAPVFYAKGEVFYFAADSNITMEQTLSYFEQNQVDYFITNNIQAFYTWKQLRPLLLPTTKLENWKMIYSDPPLGAKIEVTDNRTDMLVAVWKRVN